MTTAFQSNAFQTNQLAWQIDTTIIVDTHDGGEADRRKKRREALNLLREQITWSIDHPGEPFQGAQPITAQTMVLAADDPDLALLLKAYAEKRNRDLMMILLLL